MNKLSVIFTLILTIALGFQSFALGKYDFPGNNKANTPGINDNDDRGTWNIGVFKDKGRGRRIHLDGRENAYGLKENTGEQWEAERIRKPTYNGVGSVHGRWPLAAGPEEPEDRQSSLVAEEEHRRQRSIYTAQGNEKVWENRGKREKRSWWTKVRDKVVKPVAVGVGVAASGSYSLG